MGIVSFSPKDSKYSRVNSVAPLFEAGNILLPDPDYFDAPWISDYIEELVAFPKGKHDDQCDATAQFLIRAKNNSFAWLEGLNQEIGDSAIGEDLSNLLGWEIENG